ncbi:MAG: hypothetical protein RLZ50_1256, partial [Bacteroidota bacterium]
LLPTFLVKHVIVFSDLFKMTLVRAIGNQVKFCFLKFTLQAALNKIATPIQGAAGDFKIWLLLATQKADTSKN